MGALVITAQNVKGDGMKKIIGITGGIASGKSTVCNYIRTLGYPVIDSDAIARELSQKGNSLYDAILSSFGVEYLDAKGEIDRHKLGSYIFKNSKARQHLNAITHPKIVEEIQKKIKKCKENIIFLDIPLLFEAKLLYLCDTIVCVYVSKDIQLNSLLNRYHIVESYALEKINSQLSLEIKRDASDFVIESKEDLNETKENVLKIIKNIKGEETNG